MYTTLVWIVSKMATFASSIYQISIGSFSYCIHFSWHFSGFGKCGTTTLMKTNETFMGAENNNDLKEIHLLRKGLFYEFKEIYKDHIGKKTPEGKPILNGFKSPEILMSESFIRNIELKFPYMDFIVSMRHPVLHFQSMYNFKFRSKKFSGKLPDPLHLIGDCGHECNNNCIPSGLRNVCTGKSYFHYGLSRIMLTPMNSTEELDLLDNIKWSRHPGYQGNIFLMQLEQIADSNITRRNKFTNDLENFLGLDENTVIFRPHRNKTKENHIDICDDRNKPIRDVLVNMGTKASKWIQNYLLHSPRVVVPNRDHFLELLHQWQRDPCQQ